MKVVPDAPAGPVSPCGPCGPVAPVSPFNPVNAKANVRAEAVPPSVTLTEGVPVEASTVADAPVMVASSPSSPAGPCGPVAPVAPVSPCGPRGSGFALRSRRASFSCRPLWPHKIGGARAGRARDGEDGPVPAVRAGNAVGACRPGFSLRVSLSLDALRSLGARSLNLPRIR